MHDFYNVPKEKELELLYDSKDKSYKINLDELGCNKSWSRTTTEKTFDEIVEIYKNSKFKHFVLIKRNMKEIFPNSKEFGTDYIEVGICSGGSDEWCTNGKDYFIFIDVDLKYLDYFIKKYDLTKLK